MLWSVRRGAGNVGLDGRSRGRVGGAHGGDSRESLSMGYVTEVVPQADLASARTRWLQNFSGRSGVVLRLSKRAVLQGLGQPWETALSSATDLYLGELMSSADAVEGLRAFTEKRKPQWKEL